MTEKEYKAKLTQAHTEGYNRGYAKAQQRLESKIKKIKSDIEKLRDGALRDDEFAIYDVLDVLYKHNFEVITSVSN